MIGRALNSWEILTGSLSFFSNTLSAALQCFTSSVVSTQGGGHTAGSRGSDTTCLVFRGPEQRGAEGADERPPPPPRIPRTGEFPVAAAARPGSRAVFRRRLEPGGSGGEGEAGGVVGVAVVDRAAGSL